ncbi:zinc finger ccch domain-containing protein [Anaeramoeba flamelloides]|uniref:Zinc finger ccch domain-containing protein n=1 Tax=Anaeramoeba flamelloides TaxID=1746091 RepID=A0AAV8AEC7_9EUKA|nr:zinc finger ccch domain-containing protein [Anaeramoeba flamelloides]
MNDEIYVLELYSNEGKEWLTKSAKRSDIVSMCRLLGVGYDTRRPSTSLKDYVFLKPLLDGIKLSSNEFLTSQLDLWKVNYRATDTKKQKIEQLCRRYFQWVHSLLGATKEDLKKELEKLNLKKVGRKEVLFARLITIGLPFKRATKDIKPLSQELSLSLELEKERKKIEQDRINRKNKEKSSYSQPLISKKGFENNYFEHNEMNFRHKFKENKIDKVKEKTKKIKKIQDFDEGKRKGKGKGKKKEKEKEKEKGKEKGKGKEKEKEKEKEKRKGKGKGKGKGKYKKLIPQESNTRYYKSQPQINEYNKKILKEKSLKKDYQTKKKSKEKDKFKISEKEKVKWKEEFKEKERERERRRKKLKQFQKKERKRKRKRKNSLKKKKYEISMSSNSNSDSDSTLINDILNGSDSSLSSSNISSSDSDISSSTSSMANSSTSISSDLENFSSNSLSFDQNYKFERKLKKKFERKRKRKRKRKSKSKKKRTKKNSLKNNKKTNQFKKRKPNQPTLVKGLSQKKNNRQLNFWKNSYGIPFKLGKDGKSKPLLINIIPSIFQKQPAVITPKRSGNLINKNNPMKNKELMKNNEKKNDQQIFPTFFSLSQPQFFTKKNINNWLNYIGNTSTNFSLKFETFHNHYQFLKTLSSKTIQDYLNKFQISHQKHSTNEKLLLLVPFVSQICQIELLTEKQKMKFEKLLK